MRTTSLFLTLYQILESPSPKSLSLYSSVLQVRIKLHVGLCTYVLSPPNDDSAPLNLSLSLSLKHLVDSDNNIDFVAMTFKIKLETRCYICIAVCNIPFACAHGKRVDVNVSSGLLRKSQLKVNCKHGVAI